MHLPELENANNARMQLQLEWIASSLFFLGGVSMCALPLPVLLSLYPSHSTYAHAYPYTLSLPLPLLCTWYFVEIIGNGKQIDKLQRKLVINKALWNHANSWKKAQNEKREACQKWRRSSTRQRGCYSALAYGMTLTQLHLEWGVTSCQNKQQSFHLNFDFPSSYYHLRNASGF